MDQPHKVAKPARGQLNREIKCPCRCIRSKYSTYYVLLLAFVYIPGIFFIQVHVVHSCTVHCYNVCSTITAVSVHIMYYECSSTYTVISSGASPPLSPPPSKFGGNGHKNVELSRGDFFF